MKVCVRKVTDAQWLSANVLILIELIDDMDLPTIKSYLCYTVNIGNYLQMSEPPSVMKLDETHHKAVVDGTIESWEKIVSDDVYIYLKKKRDENYNEVGVAACQHWQQTAI